MQQFISCRADRAEAILVMIEVAIGSACLAAGIACAVAGISYVGEWGLLSARLFDIQAFGGTGKDIQPMTI